MDDHVGMASSVCAECGAPVKFSVGAVQVSCDHCSAGLVVSQATRLVRLACPRCGGNFYYIDGSLCGYCPFCDASLVIICQSRVLRLIVKPAAPKPDEAKGAKLYFYPFWHLGGLLYAWNIGSSVEVTQERGSVASMIKGQRGSNNGERGRTTREDSGPMKVFQGRILDLSLPDPTTQAIGITSLRYRGAIFPMEPFSEQHEGIGMIKPPRLESEQARQQLYARALRMDETAESLSRMEMRRVDLLSERLSIIYYPFWIQEDEDVRVWDAVSGHPETLSTKVEQPTTIPSGLFDPLKIVELECATCHEPLAPGNHSAILPCDCCDAVWEVTKGGLKPFHARFANPLCRATGKTLWLPFWSISVKLSYAGQWVLTVDDLTNVLGVLRPPRKLPTAAGTSPLSYYVPAYGAMRLPRVDHVARDLTRYQPALEATESKSGERYNCFFSGAEAQRLAYITWIQILPGTVIPKLRSLRIQTGEPSLWYIPFEDQGRELVNLLTGLSYDKAAFRGVRH